MNHKTQISRIGLTCASCAQLSQGDTWPWSHEGLYSYWFSCPNCAIMRECECQVFLTFDWGTFVCFAVPTFWSWRQWIDIRPYATLSPTKCGPPRSPSSWFSWLGSSRWSCASLKPSFFIPPSLTSAPLRLLQIGAWRWDEMEVKKELTVKTRRTKFICRWDAVVFEMKIKLMGNDITEWLFSVVSPLLVDFLMN